MSQPSAENPHGTVIGGGAAAGAPATGAPANQGAPATGIPTAPTAPTPQAPATGTSAAGSETDPNGRGQKAAILAELATERERRQAAETKSAQTLDAVAKALGLKVAETDPAELSKQLAATQAESQLAQVHLAIYRAAPQGVDVPALLDSQAFNAALSGVDAKNPQAVAAAVQQFVAANPRFAAVPGAVPAAPAWQDATQGNQPQVPGKTMDDLIRGT